MKEATENTIHPVRNGMTVELGDYGYFEKGQWYRLGNIMRIRGYRCSAHVIEHDEHHKESKFGYGYSFKAQADVSASAHGASAHSVLGFIQNQSFFIRCIIDKISEFESVDVEILAQIKRLETAGIWKSEYCVVVSVLYSPRYIAVFSSQKGQEAEMNASIDTGVPIEEIDASVGLVVGGNNQSIEVVNYMGDTGLLPIGFRTVKWKRNLGVIGKRVVRYVGDDDAPELVTDCESDFESDSMVYDECN